MLGGVEDEHALAANALTAITILQSISMPHALTTHHSGGGYSLFLKLGDKDHCADVFFWWPRVGVRTHTLKLNG
jgi:hypothetical protein